MPEVWRRVPESQILGRHHFQVLSRQARKVYKYVWNELARKGVVRYSLKDGDTSKFAEIELADLRLIEAELVRNGMLEVAHLDIRELAITKPESRMTTYTYKDWTLTDPRYTTEETEQR